MTCITLTVTDLPGSVLARHGYPQRFAYTPFGRLPARIAGASAYHGLWLENGYYLPGNGYRAYSPQLLRFYAPDSWSPFGKAGLNAYAYCRAEPVNHADPTGHTPWSFFTDIVSGIFSSSKSPSTKFRSLDSIDSGIAKSASAKNSGNSQLSKVRPFPAKPTSETSLTSIRASSERPTEASVVVAPPPPPLPPRPTAKNLTPPSEPTTKNLTLRPIPPQPFPVRMRPNGKLEWEYMPGAWAPLD